MRKRNQCQAVVVSLMLWQIPSLEEGLPWRGGGFKGLLQPKESQSGLGFFPNPTPFHPFLWDISFHPHCRQSPNLDLLSWWKIIQEGSFSLRVHGFRGSLMSRKLLLWGWNQAGFTLLGGKTHQSCWTRVQWDLAVGWLMHFCCLTLKLPAFIHWHFQISHLNSNAT